MRWLTVAKMGVVVFYLVAALAVSSIIICATRIPHMILV